MTVALAMASDLIRNASPGVTLLLAPDVYKEIGAGQPLEQVAFSANARGVMIRLGPDTMKPGTVIVMNSAEIKSPEWGWAKQFLNKSGPAPTGTVAPYQGPVSGVSVSPPTPKPPKPPPVPTAPKPPGPQRPGPRQRIVDT